MRTIAKFSNKIYNADVNNRCKHNGEDFRTTHHMMRVLRSCEVVVSQVCSLCVQLHHCYIAIISRLICTNVQLMQLARMETMCNDGVHSLRVNLYSLVVS